MRRCNILFNSASKKVFSVLSMIRWQELSVTVKKKGLIIVY
jgi:hypothetical protein